MQLSKNENLAYTELKKHNLIVFKIRDIRLILNINQTKAYNLIKSLKKKGIIKKINSFFALKDANDFVLGSIVHSPSYISFWTALNYYGWSDNMPNKIFFATTKYTKDIASFKYITLKKERFFGYIKIGGYIIAEKEKAIIDSLLFPKYSGGMREIKECLKTALKELNIKKLISYSLKIKSKAVIRRLGFLLEQAGCKKTDKLKKHISKGYELLDPSLKRKNQFNKEWLLDINC